MEEHRGYIRRTRTTFPSGDILADAEFETRAGTVHATVVGPFNKFVQEGDWFIATGVTREHEYNGRVERRFHARTITPDLPKTKAGFLAMLDRTFTSADHGIGLEARRAFAEKLGDAGAAKVEKNPDLLLEMTSDPKRYGRAVREAWSRRLNSLQPIRIMEAAGALPETCTAVLRRYKDETLDVITRNPYTLMDVKSVDFKLADAIAEKIGIPKTDPRRTSAAVAQVVNQSLTEGNTYVPLAGLKSSIETFGVEWESFKDLAKSVASRDAAERFGVTIFDTKVPEIGKVVQRYETYRNERTIAQELARLVERGRSLDQAAIDRVAERVLSQEKYSFLSDEQRQAVMTCSREAVAALTGGPGTGKSTVSEAIAEIAAQTISGPILLVAPTGKAARRLAETTRRETKTVHKLLDARGDMGEFTIGRGNPLPAGCFVLIDESSMLGTSLTRSVLEALPDDGRILFVGDRHQLPSVDDGYVLGDMLTALAENGNSIPSAELTKVFRSLGSDNLIASMAAEIKDGTFDVGSVSRQLRGGVAFFELPKESIHVQVRHLYTNLAADKLGLNPSKDVVVLAPQRKGRGGTHELNRVLQEAANPQGARIDGWKRPPDMDAEEPTPRVGDRVMFTKNDNVLNIRNGDVGHIKRVIPVRKGKSVYPAIDVELESGDAVQIPVSQAGFCTVVAYAMTGHKSQGSQYQCVIMPMSPDHTAMLERTLIYTEWTRAKRYVVLVGDKDAFAAGIENTSSSKRLTLLKTHIEAELGRIPARPRRDAPPPPRVEIRALPSSEHREDGRQVDGDMPPPPRPSSPFRRPSFL